MKRTVFVLLFVVWFSGFFIEASACIGNLNGVTIAFPEKKIDLNAMQELCNKNEGTCIQTGDEWIYKTGSMLAVVLSKNEFGIAVPEGSALKAVDLDWGMEVEAQLQELNGKGVISLTSQEIREIKEFEGLKPGAMLVYLGQDGLAVARTFCGAEPIKLSDLPQKPLIPGVMYDSIDTGFPFFGYMVLGALVVIVAIMLVFKARQK